MKSVKRSVEEGIRVESDGTVVLPASVLRKIRAAPGSNVRVRVTSGTLGRVLLKRGITEGF